MPQLTLGANLGLSSSTPSTPPKVTPKSPASTKKKAPASPGSKSKSQSHLSIMPGSSSKSSAPTIDSDLKKLGIKEGIEYYAAGSRTYDTGPIMSSTDWFAARKQAAQGQPSGSGEGSGKAPTEERKEKNSDKAAPNEDMDIDEDAAQNGKDNAQRDIDSKPSGGPSTNNASTSREAFKVRKGKSAPSGELHEADVSGLDKGSKGAEGTSKGNGKRKREPSPDEGGVGGAHGKKEGGGEEGANGKKKKKDAYAVHGKIAHADAAARVDDSPPLTQLMDQHKKLWGSKAQKVNKGKAVLYWMRMEDLRVYDNRALTLASSTAKEQGVPLIVLFVITPKEYRAHDRSPRKIDFVLRNLRSVQKRLHELHIPLLIHTHVNNRFHLPRTLISTLFPSLGVTELFANIEYEVDELRRDIEVLKLGAGGQEGKRIKATFVHDRLAVPPGILTSGKGTAFAVYSPWQRKWAAHLDANPDLLEESPEPSPNDKSVRDHPEYGKLFRSEVPDSVDGFECKDSEVMSVIWPEGTEAAKTIHHNFLNCKPSKQYLGLVDPLQAGDDDDPSSTSRIDDYADARNSADLNSSSRLSPYLAAGVISCRMVLNNVKRRHKKGKLESGRDTGMGMWVQEVAWRDFYNHIMAQFPRVSMGRPFKENFADIQWDVNEDLLQAWKEGKTGYPIVDAAMRQANTQGWMHNRPRMICASFLCKHLMIDWRLGEKYFMESFIDGDLAANNGGWQWTASTGSDPQPYFRIFAPTRQSETASPDGAYIRYWVPELAGLSTKAIHNPYESLPKAEFAKLNYPKPIVEHKAARERALFRYKNPGEREPGAPSAEEGVAVR